MKETIMDEMTNIEIIKRLIEVDKNQTIYMLYVT